jgi:ribosome maturation factor RimP
MIEGRRRMVKEEYSNLLGKVVKIILSSETDRASIYSGKVVSIGEHFITVHDNRTNTDIVAPIHRIIRIEILQEGEPDDQKK